MTGGQSGDMVAGTQGNTPEVGGRYLNILRDTYSGTTNVEYTLSCTWPIKIVTNRVGALHLETGGRHAWPKIRKGPQTLYITYTK